MYVIEILNISLENVEFNMSYHSNLLPSGRFRFYTFVRQAGSYRRNSVTFDMNNYYCQDNCYGFMSNAEVEWEGRKLLVKYPENYNHDVGPEGKIMQQQVTLNTYYEPTKTKKDNLRNIYISLFVSALLLLGNLLRKIVHIVLQKPKYE